MTLLMMAAASVELRAAPIVASSQDAFRVAAERVMPAVWRCLRRFGVEEQDIDDALQAVLVQLFRHWERVGSAEPAKLQSYACCVSVSVARDLARARQRSRDRALPLDDQIVDRRGSHAEHYEAIAEVDAILATMPIDRREVFVLYEIEGLTGKEIAAQLGLPEGTVASRLRTARTEFETAARRRSATGGTP